MKELDYNAIAMNLLENGTSYQKKCIKYYMQNLNGRLVSSDLKMFIDVEIELGRVEV